MEEDGWLDRKNLKNNLRTNMGENFGGENWGGGTSHGIKHTRMGQGNNEKDGR